MIKPDYSGARNNLALALLKAGRFDEAIASWREGLSRQPSDKEMRNNLAVALLQTGHVKEAIDQWHKSLAIHDNDLGALVSIAWVLATSPDNSVRDGAKAVYFARRAQQLATQQNPVATRTLAAAFAECGQFPEAITAAQQGLESAILQRNMELAKNLQSEIVLYRGHSPLRSPGARTFVHKP